MTLWLSFNIEPGTQYQHILPLISDEESEVQFLLSSQSASRPGVLFPTEMSYFREDHVWAAHSQKTQLSGSWPNKHGDPDHQPPGVLPQSLFSASWAGAKVLAMFSDPRPLGSWDLASQFGTTGSALGWASIPRTARFGLPLLPLGFQLGPSWPGGFAGQTGLDRGATSWTQGWGRAGCGAWVSAGIL